MINLFEMSKRLLEKLSKDKKEYWESDKISWNHEAIGPDGSQYDEEQIMEAIRESDKQRLLRFQ